MYILTHSSLNRPTPAILSILLCLTPDNFTHQCRASDRIRKKIKDYAEILGHIMHKHALIMQKLQRIMWKF